MRRLWIILSTEIKAWRQDPVTTLGGFIPPFFLLAAFSIMFGARPTMKIAFINHDEGAMGDVLRQSLNETLSPFDEPYYDIVTESESEAWQEFEQYRLDAVWVVPADFSQRIEQGNSPEFEMHFSNYIDDMAKNHRIYQAEILWDFYHRAGMPEAPLHMREEYPLPYMVDWFSIIAVGVSLLSFILGGMMNILMLTYKEQVANITLEFGMSPRSLGWVLLPKVLLALMMSLFTGTGFLCIVWLWTGAWPGRYLAYVLLLAGLVSLFWIMAILFVGLQARNFMGAAIGVVLTGIVAFFTCGGLSMIRNNTANVPWFSWLLPNTYAVDALRDFVLFRTFSADWSTSLLVTALFAIAALVAGFVFASRQMRRSG